MPHSSFSDLTRQRDFMRLWSARLFGTTGNQMLMVRSEERRVGKECA